MKIFMSASHTWSLAPKHTHTHTYICNPKDLTQQQQVCVAVVAVGWIVSLKVGWWCCRVTAVSRCYRAETSDIAEEKGIYRVHQFTKVKVHRAICIMTQAWPTLCSTQVELGMGCAILHCDWCLTWIRSLMSLWLHMCLLWCQTTALWSRCCTVECELCPALPQSRSEPSTAGISHALWKEGNSITKPWQSTGLPRRRGWPKTTWCRTVEAELMDLGHSRGTVERLTKDRTMWRNCFAALDTNRCRGRWWCRASCPRMSVDLLGTSWPMQKHGSMLLCVHRNHKVHEDGKPRMATLTFTQLLNCVEEVMGVKVVSRWVSKYQWCLFWHWSWVSWNWNGFVFVLTVMLVLGLVLILFRLEHVFVLTVMLVLGLVLILFRLEHVFVLTVMLVLGLVLILFRLEHVFVLTVICQLVLGLVVILQSGTGFSCVNGDACFGTSPDSLQSGTGFSCVS